jgi:hypothetical protein
MESHVIHFLAEEIKTPVIGLRWHSRQGFFYGAHRETYTPICMAYLFAGVLDKSAQLPRPVESLNAVTT